MKGIKLFSALSLTVILLAGCGTSSEKVDKKPQAQMPAGHPDVGGEANIKELPQFSPDVAEGERLIQMDTSMGTLKIKLFEKTAPKSVENFIKLSQKGYYNGLSFHTVVNDFIVQAGNPNADGESSIWGKPFKDEFTEELRNFRGALSYANSGENTNGSQFFIVQNNKLSDATVTELDKVGWPKIITDAYKKAGGAPNLDGRYTVFGQVIEGMDVVDKIATVEVDSKTKKPLEPITIKKITIIK